MADAYTDPPPPALTDAQVEAALEAGWTDPEQHARAHHAIGKINELAEWADEHDPQPPWWRRRARRDWRLRWGITP